MDVGAPSNFERIRALYDDDIDRMRQDLVGAAFEDAIVVAEIGRVYRETAIDEPNGAIAGSPSEQLAASRDHRCILASGIPQNSGKSWNHLARRAAAATRPRRGAAAKAPGSTASIPSSLTCGSLGRSPIPRPAGHVRRARRAPKYKGILRRFGAMGE